MAQTQKLFTKLHTLLLAIVVYGFERVLLGCPTSTISRIRVILFANLLMNYLVLDMKTNISVIS